MFFFSHLTAFSAAIFTLFRQFLTIFETFWQFFSTTHRIFASSCQYSRKIEFLSTAPLLSALVHISSVVQNRIKPHFICRIKTECKPNTLKFTSRNWSPDTERAKKTSIFRLNWQKCYAKYFSTGTNTERTCENASHIHYHSTSKKRQNIRCDHLGHFWHFLHFILLNVFLHLCPFNNRRFISIHSHVTDYAAFLS